MAKIARSVATILQAFLLASATCCAAALFASPPAFAAQTMARNPIKLSPKISLARIPLSFEQNVGQTARPVRFLSRRPDYALFLTGTDAVMTLQRRVGNNAASPRGRFEAGSSKKLMPKLTTASLRLHLVGANAAPEVIGEDEQAGKSNYRFSNDARRVPDFEPGRGATISSTFAGLSIVAFAYHSTAQNDVATPAPPADGPRAGFFSARRDQPPEPALRS